LTLEEATESFLRQATTVKDVADPNIGTLLILQEAITKSHELLGTDVPRPVSELRDANAIVSAALKQANSDEEEGSDEDDLSLEELAKLAERNRKRQNVHIDLPRIIKLPEYGSKPKKDQCRS